MTRWMLLGLAVLSASCAGTRKLVDPTVTVQTEFGNELGVSTEYGVVFLGQTARAGDVDLVAWFADGPSVESSRIEEISDDVCTAETEIRLPWVPLTFDTPEAGARVLVLGRHGWDRWDRWATVVEDPQVSGILLRPDDGLPLTPDQVGAGVYIVGEDERYEWWLVGLISGYVDVVQDGERRTFLTVVGPDGLQDLVSYGRHDPLERRWVYREDLL